MMLNPIFIPFVGMALLFMIDEGVQLARALASTSWSKTVGRVLGTDWTSPRRELGATLPIVRYQYQVGSATYEGNRVTFNGRVGIRFRAVRQEVDWFAHAQQVEVWYDPAHPERSVLEPGADAWNYGCTALGIVLTLLISRFLWLPL
jgi:hypothetical protein